MKPLSQRAIFCLGLTTLTVTAADVFKAGNTTALNDPASWTSGTLPSASDIAVWDAPLAGNSSALGGSMTWGGIKLLSPGGNATISATPGATLSLGASGIDLSASTRNLTLNAAMTPIANQTWSVNAGQSLTLAGHTGGAGITITRTGDGTLNLNNTATNSNFLANLFLTSGQTRAVNGSGTQELSGSLSGTADFVKTGNGTLVLSGNNSAFTGNFNITGAGPVHLKNANALGKATVNFTTAAGSTLDNASGAPLTLTSGPTLVIASPLIFPGSDDLMLGSSPITLNGDRSIAVNAKSLSTAGTITPDATNGGILTKAGPGTFTFLPGSVFTSTGPLTVNAGTLRVEGGSVTCGDAFAASSLALAGGLVELVGGTLSAASITSSSATSALRFDGGTLKALASQTNFINGLNSVEIAAGPAIIDVDGWLVTLGSSLIPSPDLSGGADGGLTLRDTFGNGQLTLTGNNAYQGTTRIETGTLQLGNGGTTGVLGYGPVINQGTLTFNRSNSQLIDQNISGTGRLVQNGSGQTILGGTNTYQGETRIEKGTLVFAQTAALYNGNTSLWTADRLVVAPGATAAFYFGGGGGEFSSAQIGTIAALGSDAGGFLPGSTIGLDVIDEATLSNNIADPNGGMNSIGLGKLGTGTLILSGSNTYTGTTTLHAGTLALAGGNNRLPVGTTVAFPENATLDVGTTSQTVATVNVSVNNRTGTLTGAGTLRLSGAPFALGGSLDGTTRTLNASTLANFEFDGPEQPFTVTGTLIQASGVNSGSAGTLLLAQNNTITTPNLTVGIAGGGLATGRVNTGDLSLGQTTAINAAVINVGEIKAQGNVRFQNVENPSLKIRGIDGGDSRAAFNVGVNASSTHGTGGVVNLAEGFAGTSTLDARISKLTIANLNRPNSYGTSSISAIGSFTMGGGLLDAQEIHLATDVAGLTGSGNASTQGTFSLGVTDGPPAGTVKVGTLILGNKASNSLNQLVATFNLNQGGTLAATSIVTGSNGSGSAPPTRTIHWNDGTIGTYDASSDLIIGSGIQFILAPSGNHTFDVPPAQAISMNSPLSGTGTLTKSGSGSLLLNATNTHTGDTIVTNGILGGTGSLTGPLIVESTAAIAPGLNGTGNFATGALALSGTYHCEVSATGADRLTVNGNLNLTGSTLLIIPLGSPESGQRVIASYTGTRTGTFTSSLPAGYSLTYDDLAKQVILNVTAGGDPYADWASSAGLTPANNGKSQDPDGDSVSNHLEFYLGGDPLTTQSAILPRIAAIDATTVTFGFSRLDAAEATFPVQQFQFSTSLQAGSWTHIPLGSGNSTAPGGIIVTIQENATAQDWITVAIPRSLAPTGQLFGRLNVSQSAQ